MALYRNTCVIEMCVVAKETKIAAKWVNMRLGKLCCLLETMHGRIIDVSRHLPLASSLDAYLI